MATRARHDGGILGSLRVADIMTSPVFSLTPQTTLEEAAEALTRLRIGGAPVLDGSRIVGVISKSDLVATTGDGSAPLDRVMTMILWGVRPTDPAITAVRLMLHEGVHRVLVVEQGRLVGIVSSFDVLRALQTRDDRELDELADEKWHAAPPDAVPYVDLRVEGAP